MSNEPSLVFGLHAVRAALQRGDDCVQLWVQDNRRDQRLRSLVDLARDRGVPVKQESVEALDQLVAGRHQGAVLELRGSAAAPLDESALPALLDKLGRDALLLVLDGVTDPHNLGACLRSADGAGVQLVLVPKDKAAGLTPIVRKVACGAAEHVPFLPVTNLARTLDRLKAAGIWLVGTTGDAEQSLYEADLTGPLALVMGAEGRGMRRLTRERCDFLVKLPMAGSVDSLNVSVATGICLFEARRQRLQSPA